MSLVEMMEALQKKWLTPFSHRDSRDCAEDIRTLLVAAKEQEKELAALREKVEISREVIERKVTEAFEARRQPWPPVVSLSAGAPPGTVSSLEESHGFVTAIPDPQGRTIASGAVYEAYMMNKAKEDEQHSADLLAIAEMAIASYKEALVDGCNFPNGEKILREFREQKAKVNHV